MNPDNLLDALITGKIIPDDALGIVAGTVAVIDETQKDVEECLKERMIARRNRLSSKEQEKN